MAELFVSRLVLSILICDGQTRIVLQEFFFIVSLNCNVLLKKLAHVRRVGVPIPQSVFRLLLDVGLPLGWKVTHYLRIRIFIVILTPSMTQVED